MRQKIVPNIEIIICICLFIYSSIYSSVHEDLFFIQVEKLYCGDGKSLNDVIIEIDSGKIGYVGPKDILKTKKGKIIEFNNCVATPGFIAANSYIKATDKMREVNLIYRRDRQILIKKVWSFNEEESESTPEINLLYAINPRSQAFERAWRAGITCLYISPGNLNVFNGTGTIIKTTGHSVDEMLVRNDVHVKVTFGLEPTWGVRSDIDRIGLRERRPQNRMGVSFIFRDELYNAKNKIDIPESELNPRELIFRHILKGKVPLRIRARSYIDIKAALRMMEEFNFKWILEDGTDSHKYLDELKKNKVPVIYGPVYRPSGRQDFNSEEDTYLPETPILLAKNGIIFGFQNNECSPIESLRDEAIYAVQIGLSKEAALKALTYDAAKILSVEDRLGKIEKGKDADILIFDGDPFEPSSRIERVIINGKIFDPNK